MWKTSFAGALLYASLTFAFTLSALGSEIKLRLPAEPLTLDWNLAQTSHETYLVTNLMEGLTEEGPDSKPKPALAEKWEVSPDGKTYTFTLKPNVKWSDGRLLRAKDFVDSWIRLLAPKTGSSYASFLFDLEGAEEFNSGKTSDSSRVGVKAISDRELRVTLKQIVPYFLHIPSFWVTFPIRKDLIDKLGPQKWAIPGKIATLGPYLLSDWKKGKSIELKKNPNYYASSEPQFQSAVDQVSIVFEPSDKTARKMFSEQKIDFLLNATTEDIAQAKGNVRHYPYLATYYLAFNVKSGPLKDLRIRRALALSVDREAIPSVLQGGQISAKGWIPPGMEGYGTDSAVSGSVYEARGELVRAGYPEGKSFPKIKIWIERFDGAEALGEHLARGFKEKLGITVDPIVASPEEFLKARKEGRAPIFVGHWGADYPDPANFLEVFASFSGANFTSWKNADYDKYLSAARNTLDTGTRLNFYGAAEKLLLQKEIVILPLFYKRNAVVLGAKIKDLNISPLNYLFFKSIVLNP